MRFLAAQHVERDGERSRFFAGCLGIFGHGNVAGLGQALDQYEDLLPFHPARNEQAMVHIAAGYARQRNRLGTWACTTSVGPGRDQHGHRRGAGDHQPPAGAAAARRHVRHAATRTRCSSSSRSPTTPPSRSTTACGPCRAIYERVERPEQLIPAALEAMRVLTDPAETGAVTLALPEDVQAEAFDGAGRVPGAARLDGVSPAARRPRRVRAAAQLVRGRAAAADRRRRRGHLLPRRRQALRAFVDATGIPVAETQAGRGALVSDHPLSLGAVGATGTAAANRLAREADLVIGIGTRWSDFTTASKSAFQDPDVRFININVTASTPPS